MKRRKEIRMEQIAEKVGVSTVTVSNAFRGKKGVSQKLKEEIFRTAERMGYEFPKKPMKEDASFTIGIAVAERYIKEFPSFYMDVYRCTARELAKHGSISILEVVNTEQESMQQGFRLFRGTQVEGVILIGGTDSAYLREIAAEYTDIPVICVDFYDIFPGVDYIVTDTYGEMQELTKLLVEKGHRDLMFVGAPELRGNVLDAYLGFCSVLEKQSIPLRKEHILSDRGDGGGGYGVNIRLPEQLPDAFVCSCDKYAENLIDKLMVNGIAVPGEVSVAGIGRGSVLHHGGMELTACEKDENVLARACVNRMQKRLRGDSEDVGVHIIRGKLVQGNTVAQKECG